MAVVMTEALPGLPHLRQRAQGGQQRGPLPLPWREVALGHGLGQKDSNPSLCCASIRANSRSNSRCPPRHPLRAAVALPSGLRGPVDCDHGFQVLMRSACCCRCSGVQLRAAICRAL